ncbi:MAG: hypothetical protein AYK22_08040 [Thermoplasmatales archaeon SG8-52-3]|nr:MAG: hypothetical protein AYK22_08040 [Thermoplasmatales archaeon SG8-52-3]
MRKIFRYRMIIFLILILFFGISFIPISITQTINKNYKILTNDSNGQILYAPIYSLSTYLINRNGTIINNWTSSNYPGQDVYMADNGAILRTKRIPYLAPGGAGGGVQKISKEGTIIWDFNYYTDDYLSHHDIEQLPNGNILMIAWDFKTREEAIAAGRNPNSIFADVFLPDYIIEVKPKGPTTGDIVWEWHAWDHLIQDYDSAKNNYGIVEDHPELIDINFGTTEASTRTDWLHTNSIDYNEEFDQILLSVHNFCEIWIIDHSTTTEEAAGHSGGNSGKGGDILYRWGNPIAYDAGSKTDQKFFEQHDATWIESDCPGEGNILVFNNGVSRPEGKYSSIDEIIPPVDSNGNYYLEPEKAYGPEEQFWIYTAENLTDFYSHYASGAQRLLNGNTIICDAPAGRFFEVTPEKETVWDYVNPYPIDYINHVFKIQYLYPKDPQIEKSDLDCIGSLRWSNIKTKDTLEGNFIVKNIGSSGSKLNWKVKSYPEWGSWEFDPISGENLTPEDGDIHVKIFFTVPDETEKEFEGYIIIENQNDPKDFDVIPIYLQTPRNRERSSTFFDFLKSYSNLLPILKLLISNLF